MPGFHRVTSKQTPPTTLQIARTLAGLTQADLARRAGLNRATVCALECGGGRTPTLRTAQALTRALDYTDPALLFPEHFTPLPAGMSGEAPAPAAATSLAAAGGLADTEGDR